MAGAQTLSEAAVGKGHRERRDTAGRAAGAEKVASLWSCWDGMNPQEIHRLF